MAQGCGRRIGADADETVPHCKLTDLSLGGCYVQTDAPFPECALVDFCLKTNELEVHTEGMVRVAHPGTAWAWSSLLAQPSSARKVANLIKFLQNSPDAMPELSISPRRWSPTSHNLKRSKKAPRFRGHLEDPLLELLRRGSSLSRKTFLSELQHQRNPEGVAAE